MSFTNLRVRIMIQIIVPSPRPNFGKKKKKKSMLRKSDGEDFKAFSTVELFLFLRFGLRLNIKIKDKENIASVDQLVF